MAPHSVAASEDHAKYDYDVIAIGAGSAGTRTARKVAAWGGKAAVVELPLHNDHYNSTIQLGGVGGGCVLRGCVPKKLLQRASDMVQMFEDSAAFGWDMDPAHLPSHCWPTLIDAQRDAVHKLSKKWETKLANAGVDILWGWGSLKDPHTVSVATKSGDTKQYTAKNIVICAGSRPASLPIPGAELCINYNEALALPACPKKVAIIGAASPLGMALAGTFAGFKAEVHVVCPEELPLGPGIDREVAAFALEQYKQCGHIMHMGYEPVEVQAAECNKSMERASNGPKQQQGPGAASSEQRAYDESCKAAASDAARVKDLAGGPVVAAAVASSDADGRGPGAPGSHHANGNADAMDGSHPAAAAACGSKGPEQQQNGAREQVGGANGGQQLGPKTPAPREGGARSAAAGSDSGDEECEEQEGMVTHTGVAAVPDAYASDDPKVTSVSTTRDTHKVLQKGLRSLAMRRAGNGSSASSDANDGTNSNGSAGSGGGGSGSSEALEWLHGFDYVIMDAGRLPHTQDLGLEKVGVQMGEQGCVVVDDYLHTTVPSIWAAGEVTGRMMYQTAARMEGHALARTLYLGQPTRANYSNMPMPIWSTPQGALVGMTEEDAAEQLDNAAIYTSRVTPLVAAVTGSCRPVLIKMIVDVDTDVIKGLHMIGDQTIEIMQGFAVCVKAGITKTKLDSTIGMHPTLAEEVVTMGKPARIVGRKADKQPEEARCIDE